MARIGKLSALISLLIALVIPTWAQRPIGPSVIAPGTASGTATAPTGTPGSSVTLSGGSIADGTYYCKVTYFNRLGETTSSPTKTVTVSGGGGSAKIYIAHNDFDFATGTYGYITYCSNDNVTFYLQTPSAVANDFLLTDANGGAPTGKTGHYVKLGSTGARFLTLTFSGTTIPTTNTATINPAQVALNATRRASDYNPQGTLFLGALDAAGANGHTLTTPLIMLRGETMEGIGSQAGLVNKQTRLVGSAGWNATQLAVVMAFGGGQRISKMGIQGQGAAALMELGGAGYQGGSDGAFSMNDVILRSNTPYSPWVKTGIIYHSHAFNVSAIGGGALVEWRNVAGQNHTITNGRWDASGVSLMKSIPGWTDPDNGAHDAAFPFGVANIYLKNILTEIGTGILWDCVGLSITFDHVQGADAAIVAGTDSIAKFGTDTTYGGTSGITLINTSFGTADTRVGTNIVGTGSHLRAFGNSSFGVGGNTGASVTVDFNSINGLEVWDYAGATGSWDSAAAAATPHVINVNDNTFVRAAFGDRGGGVSVNPQNEVFGYLGLTYKTGSLATRTTIKYIANVGGGFNILGSDRATSQLGFNSAITGASDSFATFRGNARINAASANATTLFIGPSSGTAAGGSIASVAAFNFQVKGTSGDVVLWKHYTTGGLDYLKAGGTNNSGLLPDTSGGALGIPTLPWAPVITRIDTATDCTSSASPAACGSSASGSFVIAVGATSVVVNTTAVTANSKIFVQEDSSLGAKLSVTCNTQSVLVLGPPVVTARTAATSFTAAIVVAPTTNPACYNYWIVGP